MRSGKKIDLTVTIQSYPTEVAAGPGGETPGAKSAEWKGVRVADNTPDVAKKHRLSETEDGAVVVAVADGSPADKAGLRAGDVIKKIEEWTVAGASDFNRWATTGPGRGAGPFLIFFKRDGSFGHILIGE